MVFRGPSDSPETGWSMRSRYLLTNLVIRSPSWPTSVNSPGGWPIPGKSPRKNDDIKFKELMKIWIQGRHPLIVSSPLVRFTVVSFISRFDSSIIILKDVLLTEPEKLFNCRTFFLTHPDKSTSQRVWVVMTVKPDLLRNDIPRQDTKHPIIYGWCTSIVGVEVETILLVVTEENPCCRETSVLVGVNSRWQDLISLNSLDC